jgi:hypothetical protein
MICLQCERPVHGNSVVISGFDGRLVFRLHPKCVEEYADGLIEAAEYIIETEREQQQRVRLAAATAEVARALR